MADSRMQGQGCNNCSLGAAGGESGAVSHPLGRGEGSEELLSLSRLGTVITPHPHSVLNTFRNYTHYFLNVSTLSHTRLTLTIYTPLTTLCFKINFIHGPLSQLDCFSLGKIPISREFVRVWDCANLGDAGDSLNNCKSHCCHNPGSGSGHIGEWTINLLI